MFNLDNECRRCTDKRRPGCQAVCPDYAEFMDRLQTVREAERMRRVTEDYCAGKAVACIKRTVNYHQKKARR